jgi:uncharacterized protein YlxW (UPF0749 family)
VTEPNQNGHAGTNGQVATNGQTHNTSGSKANQQDLAALIKQTEAMRSTLRELLLKTNGLVKALKQHRRKSKAIQSTLESLKQLKTLGV